SASVMTMPGSDGHEDGVIPRPLNVEPREELLHGGVVGHEQTLAVDGQREVAIADLEGHAQGLAPRPGRDSKDGLDGSPDRTVPAGAYKKAVARRETVTRRQGQDERAPGARLHPPSSPAPLFGRQYQLIPLEPIELVHIDMDMSLRNYGRRVARPIEP